MPLPKQTRRRCNLEPSVRAFASNAALNEGRGALPLGRRMKRLAIAVLLSCINDDMRSGLWWLQWAWWHVGPRCPVPFKRLLLRWAPSPSSGDAQAGTHLPSTQSGLCLSKPFVRVSAVASPVSPTSVTTVVDGSSTVITP
jgi:hypothetical protein